MYTLLTQNIQYLPGVGPNRARILSEEQDVHCIRDLLYCFPQKYIDRSRIHQIRELTDDMQYVQLRGRVLDIEEEGVGRARRVEATFSDGTGMVRLVWFKGLKYVQRGIKRDATYLLLGKPTLFNGVFNIAHPDLSLANSEAAVADQLALRPIYRVTERMRRGGLTSNVMEELISKLLSNIYEGQMGDTLPGWFIAELKLMPLEKAIRAIHRPENLKEVEKAQYRFKYEELFFLQLNIVSYAYRRMQKLSGFRFSKIGDYFLKFYHEVLPFSLTGAQKRVVREIRNDVGSGRQMNRLLQGDVGSGKTMVAVLTILMALDNGFQACFMAPTEILAEQHYKTLLKMMLPLNVRVELLTSNVKGKTRQAVLEGTADGSVQVLVGTHAVLGDIVKFRNLGLAIIDEQHRFGVVQRARLWEKNEDPPHVLVMTATPIPRTLAMTVYGDLDVSIIDELPPGRKPIQTMHLYDQNVDRVLSLVREEVAKGHQAYFVYPLIKESEKLDLKNLERGYAEISALLPELKIGMLHGQMKNAEKNEVMQQFLNGSFHVLVSTTVIEVGVDVPNASVMIIENAERFGLAQLHQLRGRVGRGAEQSFCVLSTGYQLAENTRRRIEIMCQTTDGFRIAEEDMKLRGPGDLEGTQQSGMIFDLKVAHITRDADIMESAREMAIRVAKYDAEKKSKLYAPLWQQLQKLRKTNVNWAAIS